MEVEDLQLNKELEFGLVNLFFPDTVQLLESPASGVGISQQLFT